jgi:23S rRNA U2552 (ribose-2'-O)-methylase RlmE/FtsJ
LAEGVMIDVGAAADGWYSIKACKMNPKIRVVAVEPSSFEFHWLINNLSLNSCQGRVLPLKVALGDIEEIVDLKDEKVHSMRLDEALKAIGIAYRDVKILKIDVEGAGLRVLKGALKTLQVGKPHIFLEVHNSEEDNAMKFLEKLNYRIVQLPGAMYVAIPN